MIKWLKGFIPVSEEHQRHISRFIKEPHFYQTEAEQKANYAYGTFRAWQRKLQDAKSSVVEKVEGGKT